MELNKIYQGDALSVLKTLPDKSINMCVTSPPYWAIRNYGVDGQLGEEKDYRNYIADLMLIHNEIRRVLTDDGSFWLNIADLYMGSGRKDSVVRDKSLMCIPDRVKIAMVDDGWICRNEIIWHKPFTVPTSVKDRFSVDFEKLYFFTKNERYYFETQFEAALGRYNDKEYREMKNKKVENLEELNKAKGYAFSADRTYPQGSRKLLAQQEGRRKRSVWRIGPSALKEANHPAPFPELLIDVPIRAGCPKGGVVLDPFFGSGTTGVVAKKLGRNWIGIELNPEFIPYAYKRIENTQVDFLAVT